MSIRAASSSPTHNDAACLATVSDQTKPHSSKHNSTQTTLGQLSGAAGNQSCIRGEIWIEFTRKHQKFKQKTESSVIFVQKPVLCEYHQTCCF